mgnify:CR=1 FL=1
MRQEILIFDYAKLADSEAEQARTKTGKTKVFYLPSELFGNVRARLLLTKILMKLWKKFFGRLKVRLRAATAKTILEGCSTIWM